MRRPCADEPPRSARSPRSCVRMRPRNALRLTGAAQPAWRQVARHTSGRTRPRRSGHRSTDLSKRNIDVSPPSHTVDSPNWDPSIPRNTDESSTSATRTPATAKPVQINAKPMPTNANASPTNANASPTNASGSPMNASGSPMNANAWPRNVNGSPTSATGLPMSATRPPTIARARSGYDPSPGQWDAGRSPGTIAPCARSASWMSARSSCSGSTPDWADSAAITPAACPMAMQEA
ncbi:hypothetical protein SAMN05421678_12063 [Actinopolymorpha cephalotaxi]|uniref:Uncharacterized protein n=1 Tax=Actinopolymorpha cephalotaxi TaxID=504797 RepID=A0A1I3ATQ5_9ACTN|nr:hypothetical protein SAMN05421678_12063 [Actinopolymorpha cephalotaxi]